MDTLESFLKTHDAGALLDIACGGGAFTKRLTDDLQSYTRVTGLDIKADSRKAFLKAVQGQDIAFVASSIHDYLKSGENTFDTISVSNALHHLEDVGQVLKDIRAILASIGTVIINEMHRDDLTPAQQTQHDQHRFLAELQRKSGEYHRETWSRDEILRFVSDAGLEIVHRFENLNRDAEIAKEPGKIVERARTAIEKAYPTGAPDETSAELKRLVERSESIGSSSPPQLTLICTTA